MGLESQSPSSVMAARGGRIEPRPRTNFRGLSWATYLLLILTIGRIVDIVPALSSLPLVKVVLVYIGFALIAHWKQLPKLITSDNPSVKWSIAFAIWIVISFSFSIWLGISRDFILGVLPVLAAIVLVICKTSTDWMALKRHFSAMFVSVMILTIPGLLSFGGGRLTVDSLWSTNELAYVLDGVIPIAFAYGVTSRTRIRRLLFFGSACLMGLTVLLSGSRGGMLGLAFVIAFIVLDPGIIRSHQSSGKSLGADKQRMGRTVRIAICLIASAVVSVASWPFLPTETQERIASMLSLDTDYNLSDTEGRVQIWSRGMIALADRPIGYGIGAFAMVDVRYGGRMYTAHNSLVLVAVELGPVGLIIYLVMLVYLWRGLARIRRSLSELDEPSPMQKEQAVFIRMLQVSLVGNFVAGQFLSATFYYAHWVNIALCMAVIALFNRQTSGNDLRRSSAFSR